MNCKEVKNKLSEYLDNMLSESQTVLIKEHLDTCSQCKMEYDELKRIIGHMQDMESLDTPKFFIKNVHARLDKSSFKQKLIGRIFLPLKIKLPLELAAMALITIAVIYFSGILGIRTDDIYDLNFLMKPIESGITLEKKDPTGKGEKGEKSDSHGKKGDTREK